MSKKLTVGHLYSAFLTEKEAYNLSPPTLKGYRGTFTSLSSFMPSLEGKPISILNRDFISAYTVHLSKANISVASVNHYLRNLRVFVYWCIEARYILPVKVKLVTARETIKTPYTDDELAVMLRKPHVGASFAEWRSWAIVNWVLGVASRCSTVCNILMDDVDLKNSRVIMTHNKDGMVHTEAIPPSLKRCLLEYMRERPESQYLFCTQSGLKMLPTSMSHSIACYNRSRGVSKTSMHLIRHTFGKLWAESGGDVFGLQDVFQHSDIRMTQRYVDLYSLDRGMSKKMAYNPLENITKARR